MGTKKENKEVVPVSTNNSMQLSIATRENQTVKELMNEAYDKGDYLLVARICSYKANQGPPGGDRSFQRDFSTPRATTLSGHPTESPNFSFSMVKRSPAAIDRTLAIQPSPRSTYLDRQFSTSTTGTFYNRNPNPNFSGSSY